MVTALIGGSIVAGTAWCWAKLIAPWVRAQGLHEELLEIQRELVVPSGSRDTEYSKGLANLAAVTSSRCVGDECDAVNVQAGGERRT
ncbi:MAG TPA: hypothetical protein VGF49_18870, partial [Candidatus Solibacter sp.]